MTASGWLRYVALRRGVTVLSALCLFAAAASRPAAEDWPEMQGKGRRSVWTEDGILKKFPPGGLAVRWRAPLFAGYSGPAVADGRVFVSDYLGPKNRAEQERVLCLDEQTGQVLWTWENPEVRYGSLPYGCGPRAVPTVDGDRVYALGAVGDLACLDVRTGKPAWKLNYVRDLKGRMPTWGFAAAPLVWGNALICLAGAEPGGTVVALDKMTGKELWRALSSRGGCGYSAPIVIKAAGVEQLIVWHGSAVSSLNPATGAVYWEQPYDGPALLVATPRQDGNRLFVTAFYGGPMMLELAEDKPSARLLWRGKSRSEINTDGFHSVISTPVLKDGFVYGVDSYGQFRCLDAKTGARIWETQDVTKENARWATAFITRQGDRFFINNDRGELIIAELSPAGYKEIDRTELIKPTTAAGNRRERGGVNWVPPAFANRHLIIRNDQEIIRVSLEEPPAVPHGP